MNYTDIKMRINKIQQLLSGLTIPADAQYTVTLAQVHILLGELADECVANMQVEAMQEQAAE